MRNGWCLLALVGLLLASACSTNADEECVAAGGVCFLAADPNGCGDPITNVSCSAGYACCAINSINAIDVVDGHVVDDGAYDAGSDGSDGAAHDADASDADAHRDAHDGGAPDARVSDATTHDEGATG